MNQLGVGVGIGGYEQELVGWDRRGKVTLENNIYYRHMPCALWWQFEVRLPIGESGWSGTFFKILNNFKFKISYIMHIYAL